MVVQPGAAQLGLRQVEPERLHQVQRRAGAGRQPDGAAGVAGDAGLEERDVQHGLILRIALSHAFPCRRRPLRLHDLPPDRPQRPGPARAVARPLAQLRRHDPAGHPARGAAPGVRPGHHAHRPGQQLRPAVRLRRGELRPHPRVRPAPVPRRARHLLQGRLRHVARPVRRRRLAQVPAVLAGPVPDAHRRGLRRHLLLAPPRPVGAGRGDDGRPAHRGDQREGPVRGHLQLLARRRRGSPSRCSPTWAPRC